MEWEGTEWRVSTACGQRKRMSLNVLQGGSIYKDWRSEGQVQKMASRWSTGAHPYARARSAGSRDQGASY